MAKELLKTAEGIAKANTEICSIMSEKNCQGTAEANNVFEASASAIILPTAFELKFEYWVPLPSTYTMPERQSSQSDKIWKKENFKNPDFPIV